MCVCVCFLCRKDLIGCAGLSEGIYFNSFMIEYVFYIRYFVLDKRKTTDSPCLKRDLVGPNQREQHLF